MRKLLILFLVFITFSCEKDEDANVKELSYVKSFILNDLEMENFQRLVVLDNGSILLNTHNPSLNAVSHIYKYSAEGVYQGRFLDQTADSASIAFYNFYEDANKNLKFFAMQDYGSPQIREYKPEGTFVSKTLTSGFSKNGIFTFFYGHWAFTLDDEKNFYTVSSDMAGTNNEIIKLSNDMETKYKDLKVEDIKKLFPGQNGEQIRLTSIAYHKNQLFITVDRIAEDNDKDKDGVLILDKDLNLVKFFGSDWKFNGPSSIAFDGNNMYVLGMYSKDIQVFDENLNKIAKFENKSDQFVLNSPSFLTIKSNNLYVVDYKDGKKQIHVFEKLK